MARTGWLAATLLVLALLLGGCSGRPAAEGAKPDLTDLKRFARDQLAAHLQQHCLLYTSGPCAGLSAA